MMGKADGATCKACQGHERDAVDKLRIEEAREAAKEAVTLVPGRASVRVEFTAEEIDALTRTLVVSSGKTDKAERDYWGMLEERGINFDLWHRTFVKVDYGRFALQGAKLAAL